MSKETTMTEAPPDVEPEATEEVVEEPQGLPEQPELKLPEVSNDVDSLKLELEKIKAAVEVKDNLTKQESERHDKMMNDTRKAYHEATQKLAESVAKQPQQLPPMEKGQTVDEWMKGLLDKYEDDPKGGIEMLAKAMMGEMESTRYTSLQAIKAAEEKAYNRALGQMPGYKERVQQLKEFDESHPELSDIPEEKKLAVLSIVESKKNDNGDLAGTAAGTSRVRTKPNKGASNWMSDPAVRRVAAECGEFSSLQELEKYANLVQ